MSASKSERIAALRDGLSNAERVLLEERMRSAAWQHEPNGENRGSDKTPTASPYKLNASAFATVAQEAQRQAEGARESAFLVDLQEQQLQDERALWLVADLLRELGFRPGAPCDTEELIRCGGAKPLYRKLLGRWLFELERAGVVERRTDGTTAVTAKQTELLGRTPASPSYWPRTSGEVTQILTGKRHSLEFMEGTRGLFATLTEFHRDAARSQYFNAILGTAVEAFSRTVAAGQFVRVLELGAGVGGSTAAVQSGLRAVDSHYDFTDLSSAFFEFARDEFRAFPSLHYGILDMNRDPITQGYRSGDYAIVVGSNAVHCAASLQRTLRFIHRLLVPGGMLLLREITEPRPAHMILPGLLPGFSDFDDDRIENGSPLLSASEWREALERAGFDMIVTLPEHGPATALGEHVVIARRSPEEIPHE